MYDKSLRSYSIVELRNKFKRMKKYGVGGGRGIDSYRKKAVLDFCRERKAASSNPRIPGGLTFWESMVHF